jgi:alpha-galactosidase
LPEPGFSLVCGEEAIAGQSGWTNAASGLAVWRTMARYAEFDAVEWRLDIAHKGAQPSPVLECVQAGDFSLPVSSAEALTLHYSEGSHEGATDFQPLVASLSSGEARAFTPRDGRSSDGVMPYFNLARHGGGGWIVAVGWTGQWKAEFARSTHGSVRVTIGQECFHALLRPGESVRTPAVLVMSYAGDWVDGQNRFRRLMLGHFTPRPGGRLPELPIAASGATVGFNNFSESNQIAAVDHVVQKRLPVDTWWIDAGWMKGGFPAGQGNLEPDPVRFPRGLRPVADRAHAGGLRFLLWFEPERVMPDTWLRGYRADWLLAPSALPNYGRYQEGWRLLNLGNPETLGWLKTNMSHLIRDWDVDVYRQDCNIHPAFYWRTGESADRVGLNEAKYITGLYEFLDYLREERPRLLIDNCASGGRRLDFEMMRRSVVLWRSDNCWQSEPDQCKTYGLSLWIPLQGLGSVSADPYAFRSGMGSCAAYAFDFYSGEGTFWEPLANLIREQRQVKHLFSGDFYPLTAYSTNQQDMVAWQLQRADKTEGLVQAFRRPKCSVATTQIRLKGLNPESRYRVTDLNLHQDSEVSGADLAAKGLTVAFPQAPFAAILTYTNLGTAKRP